MKKTDVGAVEVRQTLAANYAVKVNVSQMLGRVEVNQLFGKAKINTGLVRTGLVSEAKQALDTEDTDFGTVKSRQVLDTI